MLERRRSETEVKWQGTATSVGSLIWCAVALAVIGHAASAHALGIARCVSEDNHVYIIMSTSQVASQVTSVALTNGNANACAESPAGSTVLTALAAGQGGPLPNRMRTVVLSGLPTNAVSCEANFNPSGVGLLTLPDGVRTIKADGSGTVPLVPVTTADARVPAAMDVPSVSRSITGCGVSGGTMVFPSAPGVVTFSDVNVGEQAAQTVTIDDTLSSKFGNAAPGNNVAPTQSVPDGFLLRGNCSNPATCEVVVFIASKNGTESFGAAAAGFTVSTSMMTASTEGVAQNRDFNQATPTRTATATPTPTATPTRTSTATATRTPVCGDGRREGAEQCDDGNRLPGDCCAANCTFEAPGAPCADDGNVCTGDACDAQGRCLHDIMLDGELCDDGDLCTGADLCAAGDCVSGSDVSCDDLDSCTADTCDANEGCLNTVVVESPACGSCDDCIDNDGDGLIDNVDPDCSDFPLFQRFAVVGMVPTGKLVSVRLGKDTQIIGDPMSCPPPNNGFGAGACGMEVFVSTGVDVTGSLAVIGRTRFSGGLPHSWIIDQYVNKDGLPAIKMGKFKPFVGPAFFCSDEATPCNTNNDCVAPDRCDVGRELTDPANNYVDLSGNAPALKECVALQSILPALADLLGSLQIDQERGKIRLKRDTPPVTLDFTPLGPGTHVIGIEELRTSRSRQVILKGTADQVIILRVRGRFKLGTKGDIRVEGGLTANHVLWLFEGSQGLVKIGAYADMDGTLVAIERRRISLGTFTTLDGAAYGQRVRMGRAAIVRHFPFRNKVD